jgi:putative addiction module component (TIGR02574 family)
MHAALQLLGIDRLSIADRMRLVEEIWDSIANESNTVDVPDWHKQIIEERLAECGANPENQISWDDARLRIRDSLLRGKAK